MKVPFSREENMATIPTKVIERLKENLPKLQKVVEQAKNKDINEADTVTIVSDILALIFGFDKYNEITKEYAIKNTYCDLAIKVDESVKFLIEVKAVGITLQEKHYQQALDYGANLGVEWIILTNGLVWKIYKVKFEKPIRTDFVGEINFLEMKMRNQADVDKLYILCKEGLKKNAIDDFAQHKLIVNKFFVSAIIQGEAIRDAIRRELKKIDSTIKVEDEEIDVIIKNDIIKRDLIDSVEAKDTFTKYDKILKKAIREKEKTHQTKEKELQESHEEKNEDRLTLA
jgi:predicted type IV restriction endonuclease